jgi:predicted 2-oxoglutarate/Fe(II)-dependent dioxygenase YbiX
MAKIRSVTTCAGDGAGLTGTLLDIHFHNGQSLLLSLKSRQDDPAFLRLYREGELFRPKTDGDVIYWQDGPRLTLEEVMNMARGREDA